MTLKPFQGPRPKVENTGPRQKVLYVEDDDGNWDIASVRLASKYDIHRAKNATEAFTRLRTDKYDVILMDIELANSSLSGIEITNVLRGKTSPSSMEKAAPVPPPPVLTTPIIFVTAYSARYSKAELVAGGGNDLITKPVDFVQLTVAITRLILQRIK